MLYYIHIWYIDLTILFYTFLKTFLECWFFFIMYHRSVGTTVTTLPVMRVADTNVFFIDWFLMLSARVLLPALWRACLFNGFLSPPPPFLWCPAWLCLLYYRLDTACSDYDVLYCLKFLSFSYKCIRGHNTDLLQLTFCMQK